MRTSPMPGTGDRRSAPRRKKSGLGRTWCCPFGAAPHSPDLRASLQQSKQPQKNPSIGGILYSSPSPSSKLGLGRRILSPGRVSPIDSDAPLAPLPEIADSVSIAAASIESEPESVDPPPMERSVVPGRPPSVAETTVGTGSRESSLDLSLRLKGKEGRFLVLELDSEVLCENSSFFAGMVLDSRRKVSDALADCWEIEVADVDDLGAFKETIELMYEKDLRSCFMKAGVSRSIDLLEVSSNIMFDRGVMSCLKYIEAVPWTESEEEKIKRLFTWCTFDEAVTQDILARLHPQGPSSSEDLAVQLIQSIVNGTNWNARKELQSLINGLLSRSSVYQKDPAGFDKASLYKICHSCVNSLVELFEEASDFSPINEAAAATKKTRPLVERVSKQVENINWLLEILIDKNMAEDFVCVWADQKDLIRMHLRASPMVRYELSRISATVFIALGRGKVRCPGHVRFAILEAWFGPMLMDFGWLQRCSKGLDMRMLEDGLGQAILTLPMKQQQSLFVEWFRCFGKQGTECPNLSKAFQVWWRRSFVRTTEAFS